MRTKDPDLSQVGWHFVGEKMRDGRAVPAVGEVLSHDLRLVRLCHSGLHWSRRVTDALVYAPGNSICRVSCCEPREEDGTKAVSCCRRIDWRIDGRHVLSAFARWCALEVLHLWDCPAVTEAYLRGGDVVKGWGSFVRMYAFYHAQSRKTVGEDALMAAEAATLACAPINEATYSRAGAAMLNALEVSTKHALCRDKAEAVLRAMIDDSRKGRTEWDFPKES